MQLTGKDGWPRNLDEVPRAVVAINAVIAMTDWEHIPLHRHSKAQLIYTVRGVINCEAENGIWIVPPQCAVWIPAGLPHSSFGSGDIECRCLYVDPAAAADLPAQCCTVSISPLLRELLLRAASLPELYDDDGRDGRLVRVILDELATAAVENLHLPLPSDARLRKLAEMVLASPGDHATLAEWGSRIALSERSLSRLLMREIGMSFGQWRRQLHIILALKRLTTGDSVQTVAIDLGYESASSFVTMFRKALGKPPGRYLLEQQTGR